MARVHLYLSVAYTRTYTHMHAHCRYVLRCRIDTVHSDNDARNLRHLFNVLEYNGEVGYAPPGVDE